MTVFVYGTLQDQILRDRLIGRAVQPKPAVLHGYILREQRDVPLPAIAPSTGDHVDGLLLTDVTPAELARMDAYEIPFDYNPQDCVVHCDGKDIRTRVYIPDAHINLSDRPWSLDRWRDQTGPLSREMAVEIGAYDPPLDGAQLRQQWHMIAVRAAARLRARAEPAPAAIRYNAKPEDFATLGTHTLAGAFFRFAQFEITHKTFTGQRSDKLAREIFIGTDAAIVLPYDPKTDRVLLVEQIRMGPLMRGAGNPWLLEPIAGIVDGGETPEQAALRESEEEAGLRDVKLEKMFAYYPSTGAATDYFYCYLGLCELPDLESYTGGLASESEDLRLHVLSFDDAFALIDSGEANMGALVTMLLWLSRNRDRLRGIA